MSELLPETGTFLSTVPPPPLERRIALSLMGLLGLAFLVAAPFARLPAGRLPAFMPAYEASLIVCDLITSVMLCGQYWRSRSFALLLLAAGYLFDALMVTAHAIAFPALLSDVGLLGAGQQTAPWLYVFWHAGLPGFVLGYAALRRDTESQFAQASRHKLLVAVVAATILLAAGCIALALAGHAILPELDVAGDRTPLLTSEIAPLIWLISIAAFVMLWRARDRSILDLWLTVALWTWVLDMGLAIIIGATQFDLGFYLGRAYGLLATVIVLATLLLENSRLYGDVSQALTIAERRYAELAKSREDLARLQRLEAVGQLTGGIAHDFNNLLMVITGNVELILRSENLLPRIRRLAEGALRAAWRGGQITEQLLTFAHKQLSHPVTADLNRVLRDFMPLLRPAISESLELFLELRHPTAPVRLDTAQFETAMLNLVVNAKDAMPQGGRIVIEVRAQETSPSAEGVTDPCIIVCVSDTGRGMTPEVRARAFEPFFTTKPPGAGSGLGLSQVYGFVTSSGGTVTIDTAPGQGTTVSMIFPRSKEPVLLPNTPDPVVDPPPAGGTVLAVEDDASVLDLTVSRLSALGYRVLSAADAIQALQVLRREHVDLLFTDVVLPGEMNGVQLAAEARRKRPNLAVVLTSGYSAETVLTGDVELPVLRKPYGETELSRLLKARLS